MPETGNPVVNIGIVGGGDFCLEVLQKLSWDYDPAEINARLSAVASSGAGRKGIDLARKLGLKTLDDYHDLYDPKYRIDLILTLTPNPDVFEDILKNKPPHIRIISYQTVDLFLKAIYREEQKLRERKEEMETIVNGIQDFILVITPDRTIVEANESFLKTMGYTREDVIGNKCHEVFQRADRPCNNDESIVCPLNIVVKEHEPFQQVRTRVDHKGETRYIEVSMFPIWERDGRISRFVEISRDITERKKEEEEITRRLEDMVEERTRQLRETHAKLLHQDKMASLGKLSASVVHEINNPIAGLLNFVVLMKRIINEGPPGSDDIEQFGEYLDLMEAETGRISRIVSNMLAFSRQSKMEVKGFDLNRLIEKTLLLNANLLKINGVTVENRLASDLPQIEASEDQLQQTFMNFISNAAEAMEPKGGGTLEITTSLSDTGDHIVILFKDTGIGIPSENLSSLFEPFFTTKKKGKGLGLGLSVAYGIIQEHGGTIEVDSTVDEGSSFRIELPLRFAKHDLENHGGRNG